MTEQELPRCKSEAMPVTNAVLGSDTKIGMGMHTLNSNTQEAATRDLGVEATSLSYLVRFCLKETSHTKSWLFQVSPPPRPSSDRTILIKESRRSRCNSVVECMLGKCKVLGSIPSNE